MDKFWGLAKRYHMESIEFWRFAGRYPATAVLMLAAGIATFFVLLHFGVLQ